MNPPRPVVFIYRTDGSGRIDYAAMMRAATKGTKSSRQIAAEKARAEHEVRMAREAGALRAQVQRGFKPPPGRLWGVDAAAQLIIGPAGALGTSPVIVRTLEALATPGRHDEAVVASAGGWRYIDHLREAMVGVAPKLAVVGLRLDRRKAGIRITKAKGKP